MPTLKHNNVLIFNFNYRSKFTKIKFLQRKIGSTEIYLSLLCYNMSTRHIIGKLWCSQDTVTEYIEKYA